MRTELTQAPAEEPLTLAEAKYACRADGTDHDAAIGALIVAARQAAESELRRKLVTQRWKACFDTFADLILCDLSPVASVIEVRYVAADGTLTLLPSTEYLLVKSAPAQLVAAYGKHFPAVRSEPEAVRIEVECGYGGAAAVPEPIKLWMKARIAAAFDGASLPEYADDLLAGHRVLRAA